MIDSFSEFGQNSKYNIYQEVLFNFLEGRRSYYVICYILDNTWENPFADCQLATLTGAQWQYIIRLSGMTEREITELNLTEVS